MSIYSSLRNHHSMFFDDLRNELYLKAIEKEIIRESVVLDLGAGLGQHALMAIESGAKKVYCVEPSRIIEITRQVVESNKLSGKIDCIKGKIEEVELPEKVDCIISVFTGNFLLSEDLLPSLFYARDHFLRSGGKLIPNRAKMDVVPVSAEDYYKKYIDSWNNVASSFDFQVVRKFAVNNLYYDGPQYREAEFLANPVELLDMDFMTATEASCRSRVEIKITKDGICHGFLGWFQAQLGENWMSTSPQEKRLHWRQAFFPLSQPLQVKSGEMVIFQLNRPEYGEWTWSIDFADTRQLHSSFLGGVLSQNDLLKNSRAYKAMLTNKGHAARDVLKQMDGSQSTSRIAASLIKSYPQQFKSLQPAEQFVKSLIQQFG